MRLTDVHLELKRNPSGHTYTVARIPGREDVYLGIDLGSRPCLFIATSETTQEPALCSSHISLQLSKLYRLADAGGGLSKQGLFHSICCETTDDAEVGSFLLLIEAFLAYQQGKPIGGEELTSFFRSMLRLFSISPERDLKAERQGLWGELFMMSRIRGLRFWAPFWHSEITQTFDFSSPGKRVEVKTTLGQQRIHQFSHRQVFTLEAQEIIIASLLLREDDVGQSLRDLINACREDLKGGPYFIKLEKAVRRAGMEQSTEIGPIFAPAQAEQELAFFRSADAPHFRVPEPHGVSETRYQVDLSTAPQLARQDLNSWLDTWPSESARLSHD